MGNKADETFVSTQNEEDEMWLTAIQVRRRVGYFFFDQLLHDFL